jgi:hypothetical protein
LMYFVSTISGAVVVWGYRSQTTTRRVESKVKTK